MKQITVWAAVCCAAIGLVGSTAMAEDIFDKVDDGYADSNGVKIHYAAIGEGPLIVFIHGFPDFWYSWRDQMDALKDDFRCVAMDTRGYNLSDKPDGEENYAMKFLVGDVAAVIKANGKDKAIIVGHDWGGAIAWQFTLAMPDMVEKLVICNLPHPKGLSRELANNPEQQKNSQYARNFQKPGSETTLSAEMLAGFLNVEGEEKQHYIDAFNQSSFLSMMSYYRQNYPKEPYTEITADLPKVKPPVLMFHGLKDWALLSPALNGTWDWVEQDLTLVTVPNAGHWVQKDASELVSATMKAWLKRDE